MALQDLKNARLLSRALERTGYYMVLSDVHRPAGGSMGSAATEAMRKAVGFDEENVEVSEYCNLRFGC